MEMQIWTCDKKIILGSLFEQTWDTDAIYQHSA